MGRKEERKGRKIQTERRALIPLIIIIPPQSISMANMLEGEGERKEGGGRRAGKEEKRLLAAGVMPVEGRRRRRLICCLLDLEGRRKEKCDSRLVLLPAWHGNVGREERERGRRKEGGENSEGLCFAALCLFSWKGQSGIMKEKKRRRRRTRLSHLTAHTHMRACLPSSAFAPEVMMMMEGSDDDE